MAAPQVDALILSFEEARRMVETHASKISSLTEETLDLRRSFGRVLAESVFADRDIPPFPRSTRDGYAVKAADVTQIPARMRVIGEIKAGAKRGDSDPVIKSGEAISIMTGAPVPASADAVVMVEYTGLNGGTVEIRRGVSAGENIVAQGAEASSGDLLIGRGTRLSAPAIALAASVGKSGLQVFVRPRVSVLTTGDEIVEVDADIGPAQIRNSNSYSLAAQIQQAGGEAVILPIAPDEPRRLRELIETGLQSDLLLMTGGVSMGRYDLVEQVLAEMSAEFFFTGAKIQPGKPVVFGRAGAKYFFGLPGNPVSTMVTFELFARPILEALAGMPPRVLPFLHTRLQSEIRVKPGLRRFLPGILSGQYEETLVELVPWQGSGDIAAQSRANCWIVIPPDREHIAAGEWIAVLPR